MNHTWVLILELDCDLASGLSLKLAGEEEAT